MRRRQCLMRKYRMKEHKRRYCKGQEPSWLLGKRLIRQGKSKNSCHQLAKAEKLKRYPGKRLSKAPTVWLDLPPFK